MKTLHFTHRFAAPPERVHQVMLNKPSYEQWTKYFNPDGGSSFEGDWSPRSTMRFVGASEDGKVSGMLSRVQEQRPGERVHVEHIGLVVDGREDTTSDFVREWVPAHEIYTFTPVEGGTELAVQVDVADAQAGEFAAIWPKALATLKELVEKT